MLLDEKKVKNFDDHRGMILDSRYEIYEYLGKGATALVYLARDLARDRWVAVKILRSKCMPKGKQIDAEKNQKYILRFKNEAQAIGLIDHERIVKIEKIKLDTQIPYIVSEYVNGPNLMGYIEYKKQIDIHYCVKYIKQILEGLSYLHKKGVIHKDIRPQNILLSDRDNIKILDLGVSDFPGNEPLSPFYRDMGDVRYLSPEIINGEDYDHRIDIYSVGILFYRLLANKLPFDSHRSVAITLMHRKKEPKSLTGINPDVPEGLERIVLKAMEKKPENRYRTADDMIEAINNYQNAQ